MKIKLAKRSATVEEIDAERDRRLEAGFEFRGSYFQARTGDMINLNGATSLANLALTAGRGDLRWADPNSDFKWIAADNSQIPMDALTVIDLGMAAFKYVSDITFAARRLKDAVLAGEVVKDATLDDLWR